MTQKRIEELEACIAMMELDFEAKVEREVEDRLSDAVSAQLLADQTLKSKEFMDSLSFMALLAGEVKNPTGWKNTFDQPIKMKVMKERDTSGAGFATMNWDLEVRHPDAFMGIDLVVA